MRGIFYNSGKSLCSIYESGLHCFEILKTSKKYSLDYTENCIFDKSYDFIVYNQHNVVNNWITEEMVKKFNKPIFCIVTEVGFDNPIEFIPKYFTHYIVLDPIIEEKENVYGFPRPLKTVDLPEYKESCIPIIGSFGFATEGKEWHKIVEQTQNEYDEAIIRFNIPKATHVPSEMHYKNINYVVEKINNILIKKGIKVYVSCIEYSQYELIKWCRQNTINCFFYDRSHLFKSGLSAVTDQAIASGRPLLVSKDCTFRHIPLKRYPDISIKQAIVENSTKKILEKWSNDFLKKFENLLPKKIFLNHKPSNCGVYHYGRRVYEILKKSNLGIIYKEVDQEPNLEGYEIAIYNYHQLTMPWLHKIPEGIYSFVIPHCQININFDKIIDINPKNSIPRPIFEEFTLSSNDFIEYRNEEIPIFGSFGFGFLSKGFDKIIKLVNEQYECAIIKFVIPYSTFGGIQTNDDYLKSLVKPGIQILITHDFFQMMKFSLFLNLTT